jgi:hypothetical protein
MLQIKHFEVQPMFHSWSHLSSCCHYVSFLTDNFHAFDRYRYVILFLPEVDSMAEYTALFHFLNYTLKTAWLSLVVVSEYFADHFQFETLPP